MIGGAVAIFRYLGKRTAHNLEEERNPKKQKVNANLTKCSVCEAYAATKCERDDCPLGA